MIRPNDYSGGTAPGFDRLASTVYEGRVGNTTRRTWIWTPDFLAPRTPFGLEV